MANLSGSSIKYWRKAIDIYQKLWDG